MRSRLFFLPVMLLAIAALVGCGGGETSTAVEDSTREIVKITDSLFRAQYNNYYTVFLWTPEGVILTDPINREFATWLKEELEESDMDDPIRYVLYTHHHWDHVSGGEVFADTAEFVGHESMLAELVPASGNLPLPANARDMDANGNGRIEESEASGNFQIRFALYDENGDGALSGAELARGPLNDVYPPTMTFSDRHTITLGGKSAVMIHVGPAHSPDMTIIYFPEERVVFGADFVQVKRLAGNLRPSLGSWIEASRTLAELDFDVVVPGHGIMGTKEDMTAYLRYFEELGTGVAAGVAEGKSISEIQEVLMMEPYKEWNRYDTNRTTHIAQVYTWLMGAPD